MTCHDIIPQITDYTRNELTPESAARVASHLTECRSCQTIEAETRQGFGLLHSPEPLPAPSPQVFDRILGAIDQFERGEAPVSSLRPRSRWLPAGILAAAALFVAVAVGALMQGSAPAARNTVAKLERLGPGVRVMLTADGKRSELRAGDVLSEGDRISIEPGAAAIFTMPGVGRFRVAGGSDLVLKGDRALVLESGEVIADVTPNGRGFTISTAEGETRVLGTLFRVAAAQGRTAVTVARGRVRFGNSAGSVEIPAGSQSVASAAIAPLAPVALEASAADWDLFQSVAPGPRVGLAFEGGAGADGTAKFRLTLSTDSATRVEASVSERTYVVLTVEDASGQRRLVRLGAGELEAADGGRGVVTIDRGRPLVLHGTLRGLSGAGPWSVSAMFATGGREESWAGYAESETVKVEEIR